MNAEIDQDTPALQRIFKEQLKTAILCGDSLHALFLNLDSPDTPIAEVKRCEDKGDELTAEAYDALELMAYSDEVHITEQVIKRLDDIVDGMNNTARLIDICRPARMESAAQELLSTLLSMIARLVKEFDAYPATDLASLKSCREALKASEEEADAIYHDWRKKQHRVLVLPLVDEMSWTEILGVLEQTTDAVYHAAVLLERLHRCRQRK